MKTIPKGLRLLRTVVGDYPDMENQLKQCCKRINKCRHETECHRLFDEGIERWHIEVDSALPSGGRRGRLPGDHLTKAQRDALPQCASCDAVMAPEHGYVSAFAGAINGKRFCGDCYKANLTKCDA